jgi:hypothetical protein
MKTNAVFLNRVRCQPGTMPVALFVAAAVLLAAFCGTASSKRHALVGRDGKIRACYRVKGKPKGELRVVRSPRAYCRRGERKVAWSVATQTGTGGAQGVQGGQGAQGTTGQGGAQGALSSAVTEQIDLLTSRIESLEATLAGVTNAQLLDAIGSVQLVKEVCAQTKALTLATNLLGTEFARPPSEVVGVPPRKARAPRRRGPFRVRTRG